MTCHYSDVSKANLYDVEASVREELNKAIEALHRIFAEAESFCRQLSAKHIVLEQDVIFHRDYILE